MQHDPWAYQEIRASQDVNGNPRRAAIIYGQDGHILDVIDESYEGYPRWILQLAMLPTFDVPVRRYQAYLRQAATRIGA